MLLMAASIISNVVVVCSLYDLCIALWFYCRELEATGLGSGCRIHGTPPLPPLCQEDGFLAPGPLEEAASPLCRHLHHWHNCPELHKAIDGVKFIADHTKREEDSTRVCMFVHAGTYQEG